MSEEVVSPLQGGFEATIRVPGDKSISHRALMVGALARGRSYVGNVSPALDVAATAACLRACGAWLRDFGDGRIALDGAGPGQSLQSSPGSLDCANSGTTMRLLAGALAGHDVEAALDGDASLRRRPMERVAEPLRAMGAAVTTAGGHAPLTVRGRRRLRGIEWRSPVASAQVKSAILLAGLSAEGEVVVEEPAPSRDHTERLLRRCGVDVRSEPGRVVLRPGPPAPFGLRVPGDLSAAAFFLCLAAGRPGSRVRVRDVGLNGGRTGVLDVLRAMGAAVSVSAEDAGDVAEPRGDVEVVGAQLQATTLAGDLTVRCIDEIPVIAVLATQAEGVTAIGDAAELRGKESDRIAAVVAGLRAFGAECDAAGDGLVVTGPQRLRPARVDATGDHRLAMAWAVAAALAAPGGGSSVISGAEAAAVSFPGFFAQLRRLTGGGSRLSAAGG